MSPKRKVGVLISGRGTNLLALIGAVQDPDFPAQIAMVISNEPRAYGLTHAVEAGIPWKVIDHRDFADRAAFDAALTATLEAAQVDLVAHAGFMRIVTDDFVAHWRDRMINIHPSLLPMFKGLDTHARALAAGVKLHGCSVHYVRAEIDSGPIIGQAAVPVLSADTAESLAARVLAAEHRLYPQCLRLVAEGRAQVEGDVVVIDGEDLSQPPLYNPPSSPT
jgi:phosphoribosylglycinamide formyltransferase-1